MKKLVVALLLASSYSFVFADSKPTVDILATGGTIAGVATSASSTIYKAGSLDVKDLIGAVSGLDKLANLKYKQVYNKDSGDITLSDWTNLASQVQEAVNKSDINGVVITHGTDTMEETAYFLSLVISTNKPIVLVGSMRPATAISSDGPLNLYNAVAVAASPSSKDKGVIVAMNGDILSGRGVTKTNTISVQTFKDLNAGPIGTVAMGSVNYNPTALSVKDSAPFKVNKDTKLPNVEILYAYAGVDDNMWQKVLETPDLKGIVIAGVGDGNIPSYESDFLKKARAMGIVIVRSSRVGSGDVTYDYNNLDSQYDLIDANELNPQKARILLMLSLLKTNKVKQIQEYFNEY
jgi:L-asparaginase